MARPRKSSTLTVYLNNKLLGYLHKASTGAISFRYDQDWLGWEYALPVSLSMPLREQSYLGDTVNAVFENLLPDADIIRKRLAARIGAEGEDAFSLLAGIGRDCVGALQFIPEGEEPSDLKKISGRAINDQEIADLIKNLNRSPLGITADDGEFRISLAGAQEKTALLYHKGEWLIPHGSTPTTHILKPQIGKVHGGEIDLSRSVENEHLCMTFCTKLGLPTAKTKIIDFHGVRVLCVERFDRRWTKDGRLLRLPQEDFCQALSVPPSRKYESHGGPGIKSCMDLLKASDTPAEDRLTFFKAQIVCWLLGATDGHAKNFSVFLSYGGRFRMTPIYDIMSAQPNCDAGQIQRNKMKLAMAVIGKNRHYQVYGILPRHFEQTAALCDFPRQNLQSLFVELRDATVRAVAEAMEDMPNDFPEELALSISAGIQQRLELLSSN